MWTELTSGLQYFTDDRYKIDRKMVAISLHVEGRVEANLLKGEMLHLKIKYIFIKFLFFLL